MLRLPNPTMFSSSLSPPTPLRLGSSREAQAVRAVASSAAAASPSQEPFEDFSIVQSPLVRESAEQKSGRKFLHANELTKSSQKTSRRANSRRDLSEKALIFSLDGKPMPFIRPHLNDMLEYTMSATFEGSAISSSATVPTFLAYLFTLSQLGDATNYATIFDQYRIDLVEVWFIARTTGITSNSNLGLFTTAVDYDDANALTTVQSALDYQNSITSRSVNGHYRAFKPHAAVAMYSGAFTSFGNVVSPWIDVASPSVQHYGVKTAWTTCDAVYVIDPLFRLTVTFRSVR